MFARIISPFSSANFSQKLGRLASCSTPYLVRARVKVRLRVRQARVVQHAVLGARARGHKLLEARGRVLVGLQRRKGV